MKDLAYYRRLPYTFRAEPVTEESGEFYWLARCDQIPEVDGAGDTEAEAYRWARLAFDDFVEAMLGWGHPIPEPPVWPESAVRGASPCPT